MDGVIRLEESEGESRSVTTAVLVDVSETQAAEETTGGVTRGLMAADAVKQEPDCSTMKQVDHKTFHMNIVDIHRFEMKLLDGEKHLGITGADIANLCNESALYAAQYKQKSVCSDNLEYAIERLVGGTEKRNHTMSPEEKRVVACHESGHLLVG